jgi:hypothetical protein
MDHFIKRRDIERERAAVIQGHLVPAVAAGDGLFYRPAANGTPRRSDIHDIVQAVIAHQTVLDLLTADYAASWKYEIYEVIKKFLQGPLHSLLFFVLRDLNKEEYAQGNDRDRDPLVDQEIGQIFVVPDEIDPKAKEPGKDQVIREYFAAKVPLLQHPLEKKEEHQTEQRRVKLGRMQRAIAQPGVVGERTLGKFDGPGQV